MEQTSVELDQSISSDNPVIPPSPKKLSPLLPILLTFIITSAVFIGSYFGYQYINKQQPESIVTPPPTQTSVEEDPTANWQTHSGKYVTLKYPQEWQVTESFNEYFNDYITEITHQTKNVSIEITPIQQPYGWGGDAKITSNPIILTIGSEALNSTETNLDNKSIFFDQKITINNKDFFILAGSGYPVNDDQTASTTAYSQEKNTILHILSTFKFFPTTSSFDETEAKEEIKQAMVTKEYSLEKIIIENIQFEGNFAKGAVQYLVDQNTGPGAAFFATRITTGKLLSKPKNLPLANS